MNLLTLFLGGLFNEFNPPQNENKKAAVVVREYRQKAVIDMYKENRRSNKHHFYVQSIQIQQFMY